MTLKENILNAMNREIDICIHLYGKIPEGKLDWRPAENMRSIRELLQYLTHCAVAALAGPIALAKGEEKTSYYAEYQKWSEGIDASEFVSAMEHQRAELARWFEKISDEDLLTLRSRVPWQTDVPLITVLTEVGVKFLSTYRMQLFLYAKMAGASEINTANNWVGVDPG